jgi:hypothetical protein
VEEDEEAPDVLLPHGLLDTSGSTHSSDTDDNSEADTIMADEWAKRVDPRFFTPKVSPPAFAFERQKDDFETWKRSWDMFLRYTGISRLQAEVEGDTAEVQRAKRTALKDIKAGALYQAFDDEARRLVEAMAIDDHDDADQIIAALERRLVGSTNVRVYRKQWSERVRRQDESEEEFFEEINRLYARCKFVMPADAEAFHNGQMAEMLIRNVNDKEAQEHLLRLPATATLADVRKTITGILGARKGAQQMRRDEEPAAAAIGAYGRPRQGAAQKPETRASKPSWSECQRCGIRHDPARCPARDETCHNCQQKGHYSRRCRNPSKKKAKATGAAATVPMEEEEVGEASAGAMDAGAQMWSCGGAVQLCRMPAGMRQPDPLPPLDSTTVGVTPKGRERRSSIAFLADTGANVTGIPPKEMSRMGVRKSDLPTPATPLRPPNQADGKPNGLRPVGVFRALLQWRDKQIWADVYIIEGLARPLLSRQHAKALGIVSVATDKED